MMMSTLSSVTKRLAFCTPLVGSVASSSTMTLSFSPAMVAGPQLDLVGHRDAQARGRAGQRQADADGDVGQRGAPAVRLAMAVAI
jgi:hypothetical protein